MPRAADNHGMADNNRRDEEYEWQGTLDHERLDAYRVAIELDELVAALARRGTRGHAWLFDQTQRASGSAVLNLAEAVGREGADRACRFRISRGSALETDAGVTLLCHRGLCSAADRMRVRQLVGRLTAMLTKLMASAVR
jgi:four helix bundle protein